MRISVLLRLAASIVVLSTIPSLPLDDRASLQSIDEDNGLNVYTSRQATRASIVQRDLERKSQPHRRQYASPRSFPDAVPMPVARVRYARFKDWDNASGDIRAYWGISSENQCLALCDSWTGSTPCVGMHWNIRRECYLKGHRELFYNYLWPGAGYTVMKGTCAEWDMMTRPSKAMRDSCQEVRLP